MNEFEIEMALQDMLHTEERKLPSAYTSLEPERFEVLTSFQDHIIAVDMPAEELTVDALFAPPKSTDTFYDDTIEVSREDLLTEFIRKDIESQPALTGGELRVSGEGFYYFTSEERGDDGETLSDGDTLHGYIEQYTVQPMPTQAYLQRLEREDISEQDREPTLFDESDGIWVTLSDAVVFDQNGFELRSHDVVIVPFSYPGLSFHKIERQTTTQLAPEANRRVDTITLLLGNDFSERCSQMENDLNFNNYSGEELVERSLEHQEALDAHTAQADKERVLLLSYVEPLDISEKDYIEKEALVRYRQSLLCQDSDGTWRVQHCYEHCTDEDEVPKQFFVQREHITAMRSGM